MATTKKKAAASSSKTSAASQSADLTGAAKAVKTAVDRAVKARQVSPKIRGPIFCGIWYNPITKKAEIVNQFDVEQFGG
jgi:hypothetical protein